MMQPLGPIEALNLALSKEIETMEMYQRFSEQYPPAKDTFIFLSNEEQKHKRLIENKIREMTK